MPELSWQKSSYCGEGDSCIHISATPEAVRITESADPSGAILTTTPADFGALLAVLKGEPDSTAPIGITFGANKAEETPVHLHAPNTVVTTTRHQWDTFVLGVRAGEFDHFVGASRITRAEGQGDASTTSRVP